MIRLITTAIIVAIIGFVFGLSTLLFFKFTVIGLNNYITCLGAIIALVSLGVWAAWGWKTLSNAWEYFKQHSVQ